MNPRPASKKRKNQSPGTQPLPQTQGVIEADLPLHRQRPAWTTMLLPALVLMLLTAAIYLPAVNGPMIFDDQPTLMGPQGVLAKTFADPSSLIKGGRPLTDASFAINARLAGQSPASFRLVNIALHLLAGLILLDLSRRTLASPRFNLRWVNLAAPLATIIAGLWLVHPLQTQAVSYIVQRSEILATLFIFLSLDALAMAAGGGRSAMIAKVVVIGACIAAMLSKQTGYLCPILLLLYDRTFWAESFKSSIKQRPALYAAAGATFILPWFLGLGLILTSSTPDGGGGGMSAGFGAGGISPMEYFFTEQSILVHYLRLAIWPATLVFDYRFEINESAVFTAIPAQAFMLSLAIMLALGGLTLWALWRKPAWGFVGAWFFLMLAPTSSFLPIVDLAMEHRMYGALAAVVAAVVMGATMLLLKLATKQQWLQTNLRLVSALLVVAAMGSLGAVTANRNVDYGSGIALWQDVLKHRPGNTRAMLVVGQYYEQTDPSTAEGLYLKAAKAEPKNYEPMIALGTFYLNHNQPQQAGKWYEKAYEINGHAPSYHLNMGLVAQATGDLQAAADHLSKASELSPDNLKIMSNLGMVKDQLATQRMLAGEKEKAMELRVSAVSILRHVVSADPSFAEARTNLATSLANLGLQQALTGHGREASESLVESLHLQQRVTTARRLAWLFATWPEPLTDDWQKVLNLARQVNDSMPNQPLFMETLAAVYARAGRFDEAVKWQQAAMDVARQSQADGPQLEEMQKKLSLYEQRQPYLQSVEESKP